MKPAVIAGLLVLTLVGPSSANAQATFGSLQASGMPTVFVTDRSGHEVKGTLLRISESDISVAVDGTTRTFTTDEVSLLERRGDSLQNGALIGMGVGLGLGALTLGLSDCPTGNSSCPGERIAMLLLNTAIYAAIGTAIDAAIPGRTRIWPQKHAKAGQPVVSLSPVERRAFVGWRFGRR